MENKMSDCPHCKNEIDGKYLREQFSLKPYKSCPSCRGLFTVDSSTKQRQALGVIIALISLLLTLGLFSMGEKLFIPAAISYIVLGFYIYWANKLVKFVPYDKDENASKDP